MTNEYNGWQINATVFELNLYGDDINEIDMETSTPNYCTRCEQAILAEYPRATVSVTYQRGTEGAEPAPSVIDAEGNEDRQTAEDIREIMASVWSAPELWITYKSAITTEARDQILRAMAIYDEDIIILQSEAQLEGWVDEEYADRMCGCSHWVAYLPSINRAVLVTNGDPVWFDATSLADAIEQVKIGRRTKKLATLRPVNADRVYHRKD